MDRQVPGLSSIPLHPHHPIDVGLLLLAQTGFRLVHFLEFSEIRSQQLYVKDHTVNIFWLYDATQLNHRLCDNKQM